MGFFWSRVSEINGWCFSFRNMFWMMYILSSFLTGFLRFCIHCKEFAIWIVELESIHQVLILTLTILDS